MINSSAKTTFIPRAVDAIRLRGVRGEYLLAWTSMNGDVQNNDMTQTRGKLGIGVYRPLHELVLRFLKYDITS